MKRTSTSPDIRPFIRLREELDKDLLEKALSPYDSSDFVKIRHYERIYVVPRDIFYSKTSNFDLKDWRVHPRTGYYLNNLAINATQELLDPSEQQEKEISAQSPDELPTERPDDHIAKYAESHVKESRSILNSIVRLGIAAAVALSIYSMTDATSRYYSSISTQTETTSTAETHAKEKQLETEGIDKLIIELEKIEIREARKEATRKAIEKMGNDLTATAAFIGDAAEKGYIALKPALDQIADNIDKARQAKEIEEKAAAARQERIETIDYIIVKSKEVGLDPVIALCTAEKESFFDHNATSSKRAKGLFQLMPHTFVEILYERDRLDSSDYYDILHQKKIMTKEKWYSYIETLCLDRGLNIKDPALNIEIGTYFLNQCIDKYGLEKGLAAYNAGEGRVEEYDGIPPFEETINFVKKIKRRISSVKRSMEKDTTLTLYDAFRDKA